MKKKEKKIIIGRGRQLSIRKNVPAVAAAAAS